eukprot:4542487-Amphidinium_carterae.1
MGPPFVGRLASHRSRMDLRLLCFTVYLLGIRRIVRFCRQRVTNVTVFWPRGGRAVDIGAFCHLRPRVMKGPRW